MTVQKVRKAVILATQVIKAEEIGIVIQKRDRQLFVAVQE